MLISVPFVADSNLQGWYCTPWTRERQDKCVDLGTETVESTARALEGVNDIKGSDSLARKEGCTVSNGGTESMNQVDSPLSVFSVRDRVANDLGNEL